MSRPSPPAPRHSLLALLALSGLAVAMPLLDLFGGYPQFFVAKGQRGSEIVIFGLVITLLIPLAALSVAIVARVMDEKVERAVHLALVAILGVALALAVLRKLPLQSDTLILAIAVLVGGVIVFAEQKSQAIRRGLAVLSVAPLAALAVFLFFSPSSRLIWKGEAGVAITQGIGNPAPVVILVFDEFPVASLMREDGSINAGRFPSFARLAQEAYWFRNASAVAPWTGASITSALTGVMPSEGKAPTSVDYPRNLFTLVRSSYRMSVHEELTRLCPHSVCEDTHQPAGSTALGRLRSSLLDAVVVYGHATLPPGLRARLPSLSHSWAGFMGQDVAGGGSAAGGESPPAGEDRPPGGEPRGPEGKTTRAQAALVESLIASIEPSPQPTLYFTHVVLPHFPWEMTPSGHTYAPESRLYDDLKAIPGLREEGDHWSGNAFLVRQGLQRHLLQVGYVDRLIGELMDHMQAEGIWDEALVVVFADHGVSFVPSHPRRGPTPETLDEIYRIPLFIKVPGQSEGVIRNDNATLLDLMPSLVDVLDIHTDWRFGGRSLFGDAPPPPAKPVTEAPEGRIPVSMDGLFRLAARNAEIFHGRDGWLGIASVGERGEWVGMRVSDLNVAWASGYTWEIDQSPAFQNVRFASGFVPILVTGRLTLPPGAQPPGEALIAVNGVVAGVGGGFECDGNVCAFSAMLAEELFREGANELNILLDTTPP